jgi:elongation factor P--(R)-beta-lysine ligase
VDITTATSETTIDWHPTAHLSVLRFRSQIIQIIRNFFANRGVLEVETPLLCSTTATDPAIVSLPAGLNSSRWFLQTSPEFAMKCLLAAGSGSIYQLCKAFRGEERGRLHNHEFTMLEWYRVGFDHIQLMGEIDALLNAVMQTPKADRFTYQQIFQHYLGIDPHHSKVSELQHCASQHGIELNSQSVDATDRDFWLHLLLSHCIEPELGLVRPVFITDFPASQAALAKIRPGNPPVAERFELYYQQVELANGYHELTDASEQARRFVDDNQKRRKLGLPEIPVDKQLIAALSAGLPPCAGVALGIDRLVMLAAQVKSIAEVVSFG